MQHLVLRLLSCSALLLCLVCAAPALAVECTVLDNTSTSGHLAFTHNGKRAVYECRKFVKCMRRKNGRCRRSVVMALCDRSRAEGCSGYVFLPDIKYGGRFWGGDYADCSRVPGYKMDAVARALDACR